MGAEACSDLSAAATGSRGGNIDRGRGEVSDPVLPLDSEVI